MQQIPFKLEVSQIACKADLIKGKHNKEAIDFLFNNFINNVENIVLICGAKKVGKSFLAKVFINEIKGKELNLYEISTLEKIEELVKLNTIYLLEDIYNLSKCEERNLFNFYNLLKNSSSKLVLTSKFSVNKMNIILADLRSRLLSTRTIYIQEPEEDIFMLMAFKIFQEKQLKTDLSIIKYIVNRIERKSEVLHKLIEDIEKEIFINKQKLTINLVKNVFVKNKWSNY